MIDLQKNSQPKILVIGDLIIDSYLWGSSSRISPEAPVPVVNISNKTTSLGGAGNVVKNLHSLGAETDIISVIGDCPISEELRVLFSDIGVKTDFLIQEKNRISSKKTRVISGHQQVIRYDFETSDEINSVTEKKIISIVEKIIKNYEIILISDYGKGLMTKSLTKKIINIASLRSIKVLIDPKGNDYSKYSGAFLLTPNLKEASEASGINIIDDHSLVDALKYIKKKCNLSHSIITLSERGIALLDKGLNIFPTNSIDVFDVTGAGDTVLAALGFSITKDDSIENAIRFANLAASVVVGKLGSSTASIEEISNISHGSQTVKTFDEISDISTRAKQNGKKVVFTNGCFDIIHSGHVKYLEASKKLGDILVVGLNSDSSVKNLKGKSRPINSEADRALLLNSLSSVDYVVIFNEDTPLELIRVIRPDILVKGGDYNKSSIIGSDIVGDVRTINFYSGYSTTNIIERILKL